MRTRDNMVSYGAHQQTIGVYLLFLAGRATTSREQALLPTDYGATMVALEERQYLTPTIITKNCRSLIKMAGKNSDFLVLLENDKSGVDDIT